MPRGTDDDNPTPMPDAPAAPRAMSLRVQGVASQNGAVCVKLDGDLVEVSDSHAHGALAVDMLTRLNDRFAHGANLPLLDDRALARGASYSALAGTSASPDKLADTLVDLGQLQPAVEVSCGNCRQSLGIFATLSDAQAQIDECSYCGAAGRVGYTEGHTLVDPARSFGAHQLPEMEQLPAATVRAIVASRMSADEQRAAMNGSDQTFWTAARDGGHISDELLDRLAKSGQLSAWAGD